MRKTEINLVTMTPEAYERLAQAAEKLGPAHVKALQTQMDRQKRQAN